MTPSIELVAVDSCTHMLSAQIMITSVKIISPPSFMVLQASIKMKTDGSFAIKNLSKSSILVNGKAIACEQSSCLSSSSLIEVLSSCTYLSPTDIE